MQSIWRAWQIKGGFLGFFLNKRIMEKSFEMNFFVLPPKILFTFGILCLQPQLRVASVLKNRNALLGIGKSVAKQVSEYFYYIYTDHRPLYPCFVPVCKSHKWEKKSLTLLFFLSIKARVIFFITE